MTVEQFRPNFPRRGSDEVRKAGVNFHQRVSVTEGTRKPSNVKPVKGPVLPKNKIKHNLKTGELLEGRDINPHVLQQPPAKPFPVACPQRPSDSEGTVCEEILEAMNADLSSRGVRGEKRG